ncbi:MAG: hypothetical protein FDZ75_08270, partial [Actinobacteria bacterium]
MLSTVNGIVFALLAIAAVGGSVMMLWSRNVIHAAFWLLEVSVVAAGLFLLLGADYVALVQLLVYAGAVAILTIFTVMITLRRREDAERPRDLSAIALGMGALFFALVAVGVLAWNPVAVPMPTVQPDIVAFGRQLFAPDGWALPF